MRGLWVLGLLVVGFDVAAADRPAPPEPWEDGVQQADRARAIELRAKGDGLFAEQSYEPALTAYTESIAIWDHPVTRLQMAMVLLRLERYAAADEALEAAHTYGNAPFTPEQLNQLNSYRKMIGGSVGTIEVYCSQANATLSLDGKPWFTCPATQSKRVDVGEHVISASQPGYHARSRTVHIIGGNTARIHIELRSHEEAYETHHRFPTWLPPTVVGAGALAMIGGLLLTFDASSKMNEYDQRIAAECAVNGCDIDDPQLAPLRELRDTAEFRDKAGKLTVLAGAVVLTTGVVLFFTNKETRRLRVDVAPSTTGASVVAGFRF